MDDSWLVQITRMLEHRHAQLAFRLDIASARDVGQ
jgi:hypothetical protein